jgi:hypothetical protein
MTERELGAGAWSHFADPRAISHHGHTFTGWISTTGNVWVARYTHGGKLSKTLIFRGLGRDDHNNPSLVFRRDGHLMVFFSPHSGHLLPPKGIASRMRYVTPHANWCTSATSSARTRSTSATRRTASDSGGRVWGHDIALTAEGRPRVVTRAGSTGMTPSTTRCTTAPAG